LAVDLTREYSGVSGRPKTAVLRSVDLPLDYSKALRQQLCSRLVSAA
jgi:hypothetical protein